MLEDGEIMEAARRVSVIIPAFRAFRHIKSTAARIRQIFGDEAEIIIIINDPTQKTLYAVEEAVAEDKDIKFLNFKKRLGKGKAIVEGFKIAKADILGFIDADCPFELKILKEELGYLYSGEYDCIIFSKWKGCRFRQIDQQFTRKCLSRIFNLLVKRLLGLDFVDTQGGAKFIKKEAFLKIGYDFSCLGFVFDVELLKKLLANGARIKEVCISYYKPELSTVNIFRDAIPVVKELLRLRRKENVKQNYNDKASAQLWEIFL